MALGQYTQGKKVLPLICMASEMSSKHTVYVIGKTLDKADSYIADPWRMTKP